jgi:hypothetical protein
MLYCAERPALYLFEKKEAACGAHSSASSDFVHSYMADTRARLFFLFFFSTLFYRCGRMSAPYIDRTNFIVVPTPQRWMRSTRTTSSAMTRGSTSRRSNF